MLWSAVTVEASSSTAVTRPSKLYLGTHRPLLCTAVTFFEKYHEKIHNERSYVKGDRKALYALVALHTCTQISPPNRSPKMATFEPDQIWVAAVTSEFTPTAV